MLMISPLLNKSYLENYQNHLFYHLKLLLIFKEKNLKKNYHRNLLTDLIKVRR